MTIWQPNLEAFPGPRYQAIADSIADAIRRGTLPAGSKLPPQRELAWRLGVTVGTVSRGYMLAVERGLLSGEVGRGTYVKPPQTPEAAILPPASDGPIDLSRNIPAGSEPARALAAALSELAGRPGMERLLAYGASAGHATHREAGAEWIARAGYRVAPSQVVLTAGAQQGIAIALAVSTQPGERVLTEQLTYCGVLDSARLLQRRLEGVALDGQGMRPDALEAACDAGPARVVWLVPTIQNPTAATMSLQRRQEIAAIARRRNLLLIEDDVYGFLPPNRPPPIATLAPERTIYLASASKCITPGLRVGWLACPPDYVQRCIDALHALAISLPALPAQIITQWIVDGTADRLTELQREETLARQAIAAEAFAGFEMRSDPYGLHVFLTLPEPWRAQEFAGAARNRGIIAVPAGTFAVGRSEAPHAIRLSLGGGGLDRAGLRRVLDTLAELARAAPVGSRSVI